MTGPVDPLIHELEELAARISPAERRRLAREIGVELRRQQVARIRANVTPEGEAMVPRKQQRLRPNRKGAPAPLKRPKTGRMFRKAPRLMRLRASADGLELGWFGAAADVLALHQSGGRDQVSRAADAPFADYPARPLIGLTPEDRARILDRVAALL